MKIKDKMKPREPIVGAGTYLAVCTGVFFIGEQYKEYRDKKVYENHVTFLWVLPAELDQEGKPKQLSKDVNMTNAPNGNMNSILSSWNSRKYTREELGDIDLENQLGKACQLTVSVSESGYSNVDAVTAIPKGIPAPTTDAAPLAFDVDHWDDKVFEQLPEWVQEKIKRSTQYQKLHTPTDVVDFGTPAPAGAADPSSNVPSGEECPI